MPKNQTARRAPTTSPHHAKRRAFGAIGRVHDLLSRCCLSSCKLAPLHALLPRSFDLAIIIMHGESFQFQFHQPQDTSA